MCNAHLTIDLDFILYIAILIIFRAVVVFLVFSVERNIYDQRLLEYAIRKKEPKVRVVRKSIQDFTDRGHLKEDKRLIMSVF